MLNRARALLMAVVIMMVMVSALFVPVSVGVAEGERSERDLQLDEAIEVTLRHDPAVPAGLIEVQSADGLVVLSGTVDALLARERAATLAMHVEGVRSVINHIQVASQPGISDDALVEAVMQALIANPATDAHQVEVSAASGQLTLTGWVDSERERALSATVASGVRGVRSLSNQLHVDASQRRSDYALAREIEQALRWDPLIDVARVEVEVSGGRARLSGLVGSDVARERALRLAWVRGVNDLEADALRVTAWAGDPHARAPEQVRRSDPQIEEAILAAVRLDPRVVSTEVEVVARDGYVTLMGPVESALALQAVHQIAHDTAGVRDVDDRLFIRPSAISADDAAEQELGAALMLDPIVERHEIQLDVTDGVAWLAGRVDSPIERHRAEAIARMTPGVLEVASDLRVWDGPGWRCEAPCQEATTDGDDVMLERDDATAHRADAAPGASTPGGRIGVGEVTMRIEGRVAHLEGPVRSWTEQVVARAMALDAGALWVDDDLWLREPQQAPRMSDEARRFFRPVQRGPSTARLQNHWVWPHQPW